MDKAVRRAAPVPGAFGFPLGFAVATAVTAVAIAGGATGHHGWALLASAATVGALSAATTPPAAAATAVVAWCLYDGFVLGREGDLVLTGASGQAVVAIGLAVVPGALLGALIRHARRPALRIPAPRTTSEAMAPGHSVRE